MYIHILLYLHKYKYMHTLIYIYKYKSHATYIYNIYLSISKDIYISISLHNLNF